MLAATTTPNVPMIFMPQSYASTPPPANKMIRLARCAGHRLVAFLQEETENTEDLIRLAPFSLPATP